MWVGSGLGAFFVISKTEEDTKCQCHQRNTTVLNTTSKTAPANIACSANTSPRAGSAAVAATPSAATISAQTPSPTGELGVTGGVRQVMGSKQKDFTLQYLGAAIQCNFAFCMHYDEDRRQASRLCEVLA